MPLIALVIFGLLVCYLGVVPLALVCGMIASLGVARHPDGLHEVAA